MNGDDKMPMRSSEEALPIALLRTREAVMARFRPMLAENGLTEQQWRVIRVVQEEGELDATTLSARCCILMPSLSRILKKLEEQGLLVRRQEPGDRRRQLIELTESGHAAFNRVAPRSEEIYASIEEEHGADEIQQLLAAMAQLQKNLAG